MNSLNPMKNHARVTRAAAAAAATGLIAALAVPAAASASASAASASAAAFASASPQPRHVVAGIRPSWAEPSADSGPAASGMPISVRVYLAGRDPAGLARYAVQVADRGRPS
jgi:hypothetical protein